MQLRNGKPRSSAGKGHNSDGKGHLRTGRYGQAASSQREETGSDSAASNLIFSTKSWVYGKHMVLPVFATGRNINLCSRREGTLIKSIRIRIFIFVLSSTEQKINAPSHACSVRAESGRNQPAYRAGDRPWWQR